MFLRVVVDNNQKAQYGKQVFISQRMEKCKSEELLPSKRLADKWDFPLGVKVSNKNAFLDQSGNSDFWILAITQRTHNKIESRVLAHV